MQLEYLRGGPDAPTRYSTAFGKWDVCTARIDGAIAVNSEEGRWAVAEKVFPEQDGARGSTTVPLSDHLLIELWRSAVRTWPGLEQRPVAVRLDGSDAGRKTAAATQL